MLFDASAIDDADEISAAIFSLVVSGKGDSHTASVSLVLSTPASDANVVTGDYDQLGTVKQATDVTIASMTADNVAYTDWTLNATGRGNISKTATRTKFGTKIAFDADNAEPACINAGQTYVNARMADEAGTTKDPKLVVTHAAAAAAARASSPITMLGVGG